MDFLAFGFDGFRTVREHNIDILKIELTQLLPILALAGGIIYGYAQLNSKVDSLAYLKTLADDNMNRVIALEVKLEMAEKAFNLYRSQ